MPAAGYLMGVGNLNQDSAPLPTMVWQVQMAAANTFNLYVSTQAVRLGPQTIHQYQLSTGAATGVQKIAFQVDLDAGVVSAVVGGKQAALTLLATPVVAGTHFTENQWDTFAVNNAGSKTYSGVAADFALYGCCLSRSIRYNTPGIGTTVTRVDSRSISDLTRYFSDRFDDPHLIGYLGFTENPSTSPRHLSITGGDGQHSSAFIYNGDTLKNPTDYTRFADIQVSGNSGYGSAIAIGQGLYTRFNNVRALGGAYGISNIPVGANYTNTISNCYLSAWDAALMTYDSILRVDHLIISNPGLAGFRLVGSDVMVRDVTVTGLGSSQLAFAAIHDGLYANVTEFDRVIVDDEFQPDLVCGIYSERESDVQTLLRVKDFAFGVLGDVPCIKLTQKNAPNSGPRAILDLDYVNAICNPFIEADGPGWAGTARNLVASRVSHVNNVGTAPVSGVVEDSTFTSPPPYGQWYPNSSRFTVPIAADGQYREWGVVAAGRMGSSSPPQFLGRRPEQSSPNALAAYATDHTSIAATLSGQASSWGQPTDFAVCAMAKAMFSQTLPGVPANYKVVLSTANATRLGPFPGATGVIAEPDPSTGYAASTKANSSATFNAASAGSKTSATSIAFGTATAAYTVKSLGIVDAATGQVWATIQLATPLVVTVGMTPTINSGALTFTHTPLAGGQVGCLTDFGWAKLWDYAFRGAAFTAPTTFYACLTTAATSKTTTSLTEPSGSGYARVAATNDATRWSTIGAMNQTTTQEYGTATNVVALAFPTASGSWGTVTGAALADASSGGNVWAVAPVTAPATFTTGAVPAFAVGAFIASAN